MSKTLSDFTVMVYILGISEIVTGKGDEGVCMYVLTIKISLYDLYMYLLSQSLWCEIEGCPLLPAPNS